MDTLIETAKLNDIDPRVWLADVLTRLPDHPSKQIADLLPWAWSPPTVAQAAWRSALKADRPGPSPNAYKSGASFVFRADTFEFLKALIQLTRTTHRRSRHKRLGQGESRNHRVER